MRKLKTFGIYMLCAFLVLGASGCGGNSDAKADRETEQTAEEKKPQKQEDTKKQDAAEDTAEKDEAGQTLAKRLCGKYTCRDNDEWMGMEIVSFGENLYAYVGLQMDEEDGSEPEDFEYYSFWVDEFFPADVAELLSTTGNSVEMYRLSFSIMANAGMYQGAPAKGTLTLTEDGIVMEGFEEGHLELKRDKRAEDAFAYIEKTGDHAADEALQGFWKSTGKDEDVFLDFDRNALYIYSKTPGKEVVFRGGKITAENGRIEGKFSALSSGSMPAEFQGTYRISDGRLTIRADGYSDIELFNEEAAFERIDEKDLPLWSADNALGYVPGSTDVSALLKEDPMQESFYGIFVSALPNSEPAIELSEKVTAKGFDSMVIYSPEWENLSPKPYFCVTAGRYASQKEAEDNLDAVKAEYPDAYVKYSGACKGTHITYTNYGMGIVSVEDDHVVLQNMDNEPTYQWSEDQDLNPEERLKKIWIVDADTVFDPSCETEFFNNYEEGDTPLTWFQRNDEMLKNDPEGYEMYGPAFTGVFEIVVTGNHVDAFLGSYWWD